jgi:Mn-dependent DtxR family transcriptional regulator
MRDVPSITQSVAGWKFSLFSAMKKLRENGYISMSPDGLITLNESGLEIARQVYSRHQVITKLFVMMGVPQEIAAEDACRVEHDLSQETFERIRDFIRRNEEL